ncbi:MAG: hypothetical protein PUI59_02760 [bacterium]|nr:hypothetical protein [bacterium]
MKKSFLLTSLALFALVACGGNTTEAPTETPTETPTEAPATEAPATETPATEEPEPEPEPVNPIADAEAFQTALAALGSVAPKSMKYTDNYYNKTVEVFNNTKELLVTKTDSSNAKSLDIYNGFQGDAFYYIHGSRADRYKVVATPTKGDEVSQAKAEEKFADNVDEDGTVYQTVLKSTQLLSRDYSTNSLKWNGGTITSFSSTFDDDNHVVVTYSAYAEGYSTMYINSGEVLFDVNGNIKSGSFNRENYFSSNWDSDNHCPNAGATANSSYTYTIINIDTSALEDPEDVYLLDEDTLNSYFASSITGAQDVTMYVSETLTANSVKFADDAALVPSTALGDVYSIANDAFITSVGNPDLFTFTTVTPTYGSPYEAYKAVATGTTTVTFGNSFVTKLFTINVTINDISGPVFNPESDYFGLDYGSAEAELGTPTQDATDTSLYHIDLSVLQGTSGAVIVKVPVSISSFSVDKMAITTKAGATNNVTCTGEKYEDYLGAYVNLSFTGFETIGNSVINVVSGDAASPKLSFNVAVTSTPAISLEGTIEVGYDYTSVAEVVSSEAEEDDSSIIHTHVRAMKGNIIELEATVNNSTSSVDLDALSITTSGTPDSKVTIGEPSYGYCLTLPITIGDTLGYSHFILSSTADDSKTIHLDIEVIDTPAAELSLTSPVSANTKLSVKEGGEAILRDPTVDTENSLTYHANLEVIKGEDAVKVQIPNNSTMDFDINSVTATVDATDNSLGVTASVEKYSNSYYGNSVYLNLAITASEGTSTVTVASTSSTSLKFVFHLTAVDVDGPEITNAYFGNSSATGFLATDFALDEATGNYVNDVYLLASSSTRDLLVKVNNAVPSEVTKFHVTSNITDDNHIATVSKIDTSYISYNGIIYVSWTAGTTLGKETYTITSENTNARTYVVNIHVVETLPTL